MRAGAWSRKYGTCLRNWVTEIACLTNVTTLFLFENSFIIRIAKLKSLLSFVILHSKFLGNPSFKVSWKSYQRIFLRMLLCLKTFHFHVFIYVPTSTYLLFLRATAPLWLFSHILSCMLNWNWLFQVCFMRKTHNFMMFSVSLLFSNSLCDNS